MWLYPVVIGILLAVLVGVLFLLGRTRRQLNNELVLAADRSAALRASAEDAALKTSLLGALVEIADSALIMVGSDHVITHMNTVARDLFDFSPAPEHTRNPSLISMTRSHELDDLIGIVLEEPGEDYGIQIRVRDSNYRVNARHVEIASSKYVMLALEDITELQRLGRARRDFIANISHELRTPITSIRLLVDTILREDEIAPGNLTKLLNKIATETDTLQQMAQELLDLSMIESGRAEIALLPASMKGIINKSVEGLAEQARRKNIEISVDGPLKLKVLADDEQVRRVVTNLLHNAIKFTPQYGKITISVEKLDKEWAQICVTDSGPGIREELRERIFERFYQLDTSRRMGTGLGLAIAKHIVQAHGGRIWAEDSPSPPGARLCFLLPLAD